METSSPDRPASPANPSRSSPTVLNIPKVSLVPASSCPSSNATTAPASETASIEDPDESIGEFDDGRTGKLTLATLIQEGLIEPGEGVMSIDYLGQTFKGDLMPMGKIRSQETRLVFNNPSAWAIYCKKIVNPSKKSGCGWASVKYKGRKMDHFKTVWTKLKSQRDTEEAERRSAAEDDEALESGKASDGLDEVCSVIIRHHQLGPKQPHDALDMLLEVDTFASQGKIQPFTLSTSSSALLLVDIHTHLSTVPVCGYLAGHWDLNTHNLAITHAFPCLSDTDLDADAAAKVEYEIYNNIYGKHLSLVGWYRSAPRIPRALPTLKDCESQLDYQVKLLGNSDSTYSPCVGLIVKPFASLQNESDMCFYWVVPPPENSPQEYGKPMKMARSTVIDPCLSQEVLDQIDSLTQFYKRQEKNKVQLHENFNSDTLLVTKMGRSLLSKFPRDQDERLWRYIRLQLLGSRNSDLPDPLISHHTPTNGAFNSHADNDDEEEEEIDDDEEEEIDDDEENALRRRRGFRTLSTQSNGCLTVTASNRAALPVASTAEVISMLLQKQAPVAPMAHGASAIPTVQVSTTVTPIPAPMAHGASAATPAANTTDEEAPLDFSSSGNTKREETDESDEEKLTIQE